MQNGETSWNRTPKGHCTKVPSRIRNWGSQCGDRIRLPKSAARCPVQQAGGRGMGVSQAWDLGPFAAVLQCLLKQQNTKKLYGTKNRCMPVQLGASLMAQWVPKGVGKSPKPPTGLDGPLPSSHIRTSLPHLGGKASKGRWCFFFLIFPAVAGAPEKPRLNFLSDL